jgi:hypothetical protein
MALFASASTDGHGTPAQSVVCAGEKRASWF